MDFDFRTVGEVLQHYPRDYRDCRYEMEDGRFATVLGTVVRCSAIAGSRILSKLPLTFSVDPDRLRQLDEGELCEPSGTFFYPPHYLQQPNITPQDISISLPAPS